MRTREEMVQSTLDVLLNSAFMGSVNDMSHARRIAEARISVVGPRVILKQQMIAKNPKWRNPERLRSLWEFVRDTA